MAGSLWEWCNDWHTCNLGTAPATDPAGPEGGSSRVLRGRSCFHYDHVHIGSDLRCAYRYVSGDPDFSSDGYGFHVAGTVDR